jgi:hypothetical protein
MLWHEGRFWAIISGILAVLVLKVNRILEKNDKIPI